MPLPFLPLKVALLLRVRGTGHTVVGETHTNQVVGKGQKEFPGTMEIMLPIRKESGTSRARP